MRVFSFVLVLALLVVCASAVSVPYKWCGSSSDDATIQSITSNEFPPKAGDTLTLNVTGNLSKEVTDGTYLIKIVIDGIIPLPSENGSISVFRPLPWPEGALNFSYSRPIPAAAPTGSYVVTISAIDQDYVQIFCISVAFKLSAADGQVRAALPSTQDTHTDTDTSSQENENSDKQELQHLVEHLQIPLSSDEHPRKLRVINRWL